MSGPAIFPAVFNRRSEITVKDDTPLTDAGAVAPAFSQPVGVSRRCLLGGAALGLAAITLGALPVVQAADDAQDNALADFIRVSGVLTARQQLNPVLAGLIFGEMKKEDPAFADQLSSLVGVIHQPPAQWSASMTALAREITSVWYTGLIGSGDTMRVVTYEGALQFSATKDIFIVRSYCPNRPGFWASQPSGWRV